MLAGAVLGGGAPAALAGIFLGMVAALVLLGGACMLGRGEGPWVLLGATWVGFFILWPYLDMRFLMPCFPLCYIAILRALQVLRSSARWQRAGTSMAAAILATVIGAQAIAAAGVVRDAHCHPHLHALVSCGAWSEGGLPTPPL